MATVSPQHEALRANPTGLYLAGVGAALRVLRQEHPELDAVVTEQAQRWEQALEAEREDQTLEQPMNSNPEPSTPFELLEVELRMSRLRIRQLERQVEALLSRRRGRPMPVGSTSARDGLVGVPWVQDALRKLVDPRLEVDGIEGPATRAAARVFQAEQGLPVDGRIGPKTRAALLCELHARGLGDDT